MKKILLDVNVLLDVLLDREPHAGGSSAIWAAVESGAASGVLAAHAVTTIHYLAMRSGMTARRARRMLRQLTTVFGVAEITTAVIERALELPCPDFEDAVSAAAAELAGCSLIVTRDEKGFRGSPVPALGPEAALHVISGNTAHP